MLFILFALLLTASPGQAWHPGFLPSEANVQVKTDPTNSTWPWRSFKSAPYLPPNFTITGNGKPLADGLVFLTPDVGFGNATEESGGFIVTSDGELVYALPLAGITDFRRQYYNGSAYLTYWSGFNTNYLNIGHGYGRVNFIDENYETFYVNPELHLTQLLRTMPDTGSIDIHEHQMTPRNTILVTAYNNTPHDLTAVGAPADAWIVDGLIFEIDIATQQTLFSWRAVDHVPLSASKQPIPGNSTKDAPWDWFHVNSIQAVGDNYLVNSRHCWTTYLVSGKDGSVIWSIQGEDGGSFGTLPSNGTFRWQHHARAHNVTDTSLDLSIFDNHNSASDGGTGESKAIVYHLELPPNNSTTPLLTRRLVTASDPLYAASQGNYVAHLENGNQFVGYGQIPISREYGPASDGSDLRWQAQFGGDAVQSYRGFKETWRATPKGWDPSLVVEDGQAYVSWNGATEVRAWNVYAGRQNCSLRFEGVALKKGFETVFAIPHNASFVQVGAVQGRGEVRRSNVAQA